MAADWKENLKYQRKYAEQKLRELDSGKKEGPGGAAIFGNLFKPTKELGKVNKKAKAGSETTGSQWESHAKKKAYRKTIERAKESGY